MSVSTRFAWPTTSTLAWMSGSPVVLSRTVPTSVPCSGGGVGAPVGSVAHSTGAAAVIADRHTSAQARRTNIPRRTSASGGSYAEEVSGRLRIDEVDAIERLRHAHATPS